MYRLLNSAVMPVPGLYRLYTIEPIYFRDQVCLAYDNGMLVSYIDYQQTADFLMKLCKVPIVVSRESTTVNDKDVLLICKLKYRVADPGTKGQPISEDDFDFYLCKYSEWGKD